MILKRTALAVCILWAAMSAEATADGNDDGLGAAQRSARIAGYALSKVQRWLHEVALQRIDPNWPLRSGRQMELRQHGGGLLSVPGLGGLRR